MAEMINKQEVLDVLDGLMEGIEGTYALALVDAKISIKELPTYTETTKNGTLIIKSKMAIKYEDMKVYREHFHDELEEGVVLLPHFMDAIYVPEGVTLKVQNEASGLW